MRLNRFVRLLLGAVAFLSVMSLGIDESRGQSREQLEKIARETGSGILVLQAGSQKLVLPSTNLTGVLEIDLGTTSLATELSKREEFARPQARTELLSFARQLVSIAVKHRQEGKLPEALFLYRFALLVASRFQEWDGVKAVASNLWFLREAVEDYVNGESLPLLSALHKQANLPEIKDRREYFKQLLGLIQADAQLLSPTVEDLLSKLSSSANSQQLIMLECARLIADLADNVDLRRTHLLTLKTVTKSLNEPQAFQVAVTQELAQATIMDFLNHEGLIKDKQTGFDEVWHLYFDNRKELTETGNAQEIFSNLVVAFRSFTYLRAAAVRGGGSFGHRISYVISGFLQPIGRDLVYLLMKMGQPEAALEMAENTRARALGDWMARSHPTNRLMSNPYELGSVGEVMPATLDEIKQAASKVTAPVLIYLADHSGYSVWLQSTNGKLISARIENPEMLIEKVFRSLPYTTSSEQLGRAERSARGAGVLGVNDKRTLDGDLKSLYKVLFPKEIRQALKHEGERLVIIPDGLLNYIPFCALKTEDDKYLVEKNELAYWPSVTAWLLTETAASQRIKANRMKSVGISNSNRAAVVLADPLVSGTHQVVFRGQTREVKFDSLPGTAEEAKAIAKLLKSKIFTGKNATLTELRSTTQNVPILHLATHGFLNEENAETSFILFSDGILTARELYENAGMFRPDLVMLSACQTGLGMTHTDSSIGLSNAFLVAGANTVGSTLWQIPDEASAHLMTIFYSKVARRENLPASLRQAQLALLKHPQWKDPYNWAAYKLLGRLDNPLQ